MALVIVLYLIIENFGTFVAVAGQLLNELVIKVKENYLFVQYSRLPKNQLYIFATFNCISKLQLFVVLLYHSMYDEYNY